MLIRLIPLLVLAGPALAESAIAEMICAPRAEIVARLRGY